MTRLSTHFNKRTTPQTEKAHPKQQKNNARGFSFVLDDWGRLERFLVLGADGGTYYVSERELARSNAQCVERCLDADGARTVETIASFSEAGRAPKNDPAIFSLALAAAHSNPETRALALKALPRVCRISTHLFSFIDDVEKMRGWGAELRNAVSKWYLDKPADRLAYQVVKYRQRGGRSHRDVLRQAHPTPVEDGHRAVFRWVITGELDMGERVVKRRGAEPVTYSAIPETAVPKLIEGFVKLQNEKHTESEVVGLIEEFGFTHEMLPTDWKNSAAVWNALFQKMPITALIRNLNKLTACGVLKPLAGEVQQAVERITDTDILKKGRVHPVALLVAQKIYGQGKGEKGKLSWSPVPQITDALNEAFYSSFKLIEPTGKNILLGLDVSGSMSWGQCVGCPLMPSEGAAAMSMATARSEKNWGVRAFAHEFRDLNISPAMPLEDVLRATRGLSFGGTDCSLPMRWALQQKVEVDAFQVYTDNETWVGGQHPHEALEEYRQKMGRDAKLIVVGMTATKFSIANQEDPGMLDVVGFDASAPSIMADFIRSPKEEASMPSTGVVS